MADGPGELSLPSGESAMKIPPRLCPLNETCQAFPEHGDTNSVECLAIFLALMCLKWERPALGGSLSVATLDPALSFYFLRFAPKMCSGSY